METAPFDDLDDLRGYCNIGMVLHLLQLCI